MTKLIHNAPSGGGKFYEKNLHKMRRLGMTVVVDNRSRSRVLFQVWRSGKSKS